MINSYKVGVIQTDIQSSKEANRRQIVALVEEAAREGVLLVALPERIDAIASPPSEPEPLDGPTIQAMSDLAIRHGLWIQCGSILEKNSRGKPYNTSVLLNPQGEVSAIYRKIHLFDVKIENGLTYSESRVICAGNEIVSVQTDLGNFGFTICYDIRFPELFRLLSLQGVNVIFTPANFTKDTGMDHWEVILRTRAIENGCYVIAAAQSGQKPKFTAYGNSMVIDPWGRVIARASGDEVGVLVADIDLGLIASTRRQLPCLSNRREDVYELYAKTL